ncbi:MAG: AIR synthase family protein [Thermodesulfobacteriota bacterium]
MKKTKGHQRSQDLRLLPGKLPLNILDRLLKRYTSPDSRVVIGPSIGIDAAVIRFGGSYLIAKTDPITFVARDIGLYAININANDIAVMGGKPRWFLATILLPEEGATDRMAEDIFSQLSRACREIGVTLCGGHTEITFGIDRPIVIGQMLGEVKKDKLVTAAGARIGDDVILTKGIAIEGTSIMARKMGKELKGRFSDSFIRRCIGFTKKPGISVLKDADIAVKKGGIHAMHDPTEGGLATGLHELAMASDVGAVVDKDAITILPECIKFCNYFGLDPLGLIASGALIITLDPEHTGRVLRGLDRGGIKSSVIGKVVSRRNGIRLLEDGKKRVLKPFDRDEITKIIS